MSGFRWMCAAGLVLAVLSVPLRAVAQTYGLSHDRSTGTSLLVQVNASSGSTTPLGPGLAGCCEFGVGASAIDSVGQVVYAVGPDPAGALQLVQYSVTSGIGTVVGSLGGSDRVVGLEFESSTQRLIGLLATPVGVMRLASINTGTGVATEINSGLTECCVLEPGLSALTGGDFLFVGRLRTDPSATRAVYALSTSGSNAVTSTALPAGTTLAALAADGSTGLVYALQQVMVSPGEASLQLVRMQGAGLSPVGTAADLCCAVAIDTATVEGGALRVLARDPATSGLSILSFQLATGVASFGAAALPDTRTVHALLGATAITPAVVITESGAGTAVTEGGATDSYSIVLATQPTANVTVIVTPASQLGVNPVSLVFDTTSWNMPQTVTVTAVDDGITEGSHSGAITHIASGGGYTGIGIANVNASITDNDSASLAISDVSAIEGNSGNTSFTFNVNLTGALASGFTVPVSSADGSAIAGSDYIAISGGTQLSFAGTMGETQTVTVNVQGDAVVEPNEGFIVNLAGPSSPLVTLSDASGTGSIVNDDSATVGIDSVVQPEGDGGASTFTFTATLTGEVQGGFALPYQSTNGTASSGTDYTAVSGSLTFTGSNGQTRNVLVAVSGDTLPEADETFFVDLAPASVAGVSVVPTRGTGTIVNDDLAADVSVSNSNGLTMLIPGQTTTYQVVIGNTSSVVDLPAVAVLHTLSPALINVSWTCSSSGSASCPATSGSGPISATLAMPKASSFSYTVTATVAPTSLSSIDATVSATVQPPYSDPNLANNSVTDSDSRVWDSFSDGFE